MKRIKYTIVKNAFANIVRGGASAVVALALPHFFTKNLSADRFAAWSLMLQIAAYAGYLDFGLQTALSRFLAQAIELDQRERRDRIINTSVVMLSIAGAVAFLVIGVVLWQIPSVFHGVPAGLVPEFRRATALMALATCISLPLSAATGALVGMHKNEYPAMAIASSRIVGAVLAIVVAHYTSSLTYLSACVAIPNVAAGLYQSAVVRVILRDLRLSFSLVSRAMASELMKYCTGLTAWSFSMFLVTGLDVTLVAHFRFSAVGYYSIAAVLINFIAGLNAAVFSSLMTPMAALYARGQVDVVRRLVLTSTKVNTYGNMLIFLLTCLGGYWVLTLWVGPAYGTQARPILVILAAAQAVRLTGYAFSVMLVATGYQAKGIAQGLAEALPNLLFSVVLAHIFGPIGVAWGTLIGAFCGMAWLVTFTMQATFSEIPIHKSEFMISGIILPVVVASPLVISVLAAPWTTLDVFRVSVTSACLALSLYLAHRSGYFPSSWRVTEEL